MPIRFAVANSSSVSARAHYRRVARPLNAANDNGGGIGGEQLLNAALRHFAVHGLSAAERARHNAEQAFFAGRSEDYRWWMAICSTLDRRMPAAVAFRHDAAPAR